MRVVMISSPRCRCRAHSGRTRGGRPTSRGDGRAGPGRHRSPGPEVRDGGPRSRSLAVPGPGSGRTTRRRARSGPVLWAVAAAHVRRGPPAPGSRDRPPGDRPQPARHEREEDVQPVVRATARGRLHDGITPPHSAHLTGLERSARLKWIKVSSDRGRTVTKCSVHGAQRYFLVVTLQDPTVVFMPARPRGTRCTGRRPEDPRR